MRFALGFLVGVGAVMLVHRLRQPVLGTVQPNGEWSAMPALEKFTSTVKH